MPEVNLLAALFLIPLTVSAADLRLGIIGGAGDTSITFAQMLNDVAGADNVPGARVVAVYRGGRIDKLGLELRSKWKVEIAPDVASLCRRVDGVIVGSAEETARLEQIKTVIAAGKPIFLEAPLAATPDAARAIVKLLQDSGLPWFSASAFRFGEISEMKGTFLTGVEAYGPGPIGPRNHTVEILYALLGRGCEQVAYTDQVVGQWPGGRIGKIHAAPAYKAKVMRNQDAARSPSIRQDYRALLVEAVKFFETKEAPVPPEETLEIFEFLDAAARSKAADGAPMKLR